MSFARREDARECKGGEDKLEGRKWEESLGKQETEKEGIWKVERRRVGEAFSLVNNRLRHISHMIFSLYPPSHFSFLIHFSFAPSLTRFLFSHKHGLLILSFRGWKSNSLLHPSCSQTLWKQNSLPLLAHRSAVSGMLTLVFHCTPFPSPLTHSCLEDIGDGGGGGYCLDCVCV